MSALPPLRFKPILREYIWGGRRLAELGKPLGEGDQYAESWEVVDHGAEQSIVAEGPLAGTTLHQLVTHHGEALFGQHHPQRQFPLLFKFLDCQQTLSVQVHPNDAEAAQLDPPDLGKTEAWVVLAAAPGSKIYAGLKSDVDRATLESALASGTVDACLHQFEPRVGECVLIEAGTVHALGAGLLVAEIQQASDTTYRLFDWNRIDRDGRPRKLHVDEALAAIEFQRGPVRPVQRRRTERPLVERLVECDKFVLDAWRLGAAQSCGGDERFHILSIAEGRATISAGNASHTLERGGTILVPASAHDLKIVPQGRAVLLDMYLP